MVAVAVNLTAPVCTRDVARANLSRVEHREQPPLPSRIVIVGYFEA